MKKALGILALAAFACGIGSTGWWLWKKSRTPPRTWATETPAIADIVHKAVATGSVVPRQEVEIKPQISGIVERLHVEPGQKVAKDDVIATILVVPDMVDLNNAETRLNRARIGRSNAERDLQRNRELREEGVISDAQLQSFEKAWEEAREELDAATANLELVRKGTARRIGRTTNTLVRSTISGTVLSVPLEVGASVIQSNNFNDGTTIATVADMDDLIFKGKVDESEVGKIAPGMALVLRIGALEGRTFDAVLEYIAPKGVEEEGAIRFEIRAALRKPPDVLVRANLSANADIVLARRDRVLSIAESLLQFHDGKPFVEVETAPQVFERRPIETGLSDGLRIEVVSGVSEKDRIKNAAKGPSS